MSEMRFEEKIIYKTRQHWIIPFIASLKLLIVAILPLTCILYFIVNYSILFTIAGFFILSFLILGYEHYLWHHSWLFVGNQKITLAIRNGIFSQYAMSIRYRNIRDCAVSKNSMIGFFLKYGSIFIRSTSADGDFTAKFVPKVGKVYALINALSRYSDDERSYIDSIEKLHAYHTKKEFSGKISHDSLIEKNKATLRSLPGITEVVELQKDAREYIISHEEARNHGVHEVLSREHVLCFLHDSFFRVPTAPIVRQNARGESYFPGVPFPEISGKDVVSASPGSEIHAYLLQYFPYATTDEATVIVGWNEL